MMAGGTYVYPDWSINMGWLMTASSISCIPAYFIYKVYKTPGPFMQRIRLIMKPEDPEPDDRGIVAIASSVHGSGSGGGGGGTHV